MSNRTPTSDECSICGVKYLHGKQQCSCNAGRLQPLTSKQRLRTLRKTVEHYARSERGLASSETIKELTEAAAVLQALENAPETCEQRYKAALEWIAGTNGVECSAPRVVAGNALKANEQPK